VEANERAAAEAKCTKDRVAAVEEAAAEAAAKEAAAAAVAACSEATDVYVASQSREDLLIEEQVLEALVSRRKTKHSYEYECKWLNKSEELNTWIEREKLEVMGGKMMIDQLDQFDNTWIMREKLEEMGRYVCMYVCMYVCIKYIYIHICICIYVCVCVYIYIYIYIHTCNMYYIYMYNTCIHV
jgi:hypothetical protein